MMRAPGNLAFRYTDLYFTTVTVKDWKWLLAPDKYKKIITESLHYVLERFKVERKDRTYQFYKERPLSIPIYTDAVASQKIEYIHRNPIQPKWKLSKEPAGYHWSSAAFYEFGGSQWPFLTHFWYGEDPMPE